MSLNYPAPNYAVDFGEILKHLENPEAWVRVLANGLRCEPFIKEQLNKLDDLGGALTEVNTSLGWRDYPTAWAEKILEDLGLHLDKENVSLEAVASEWLMQCVDSVGFCTVEEQTEQHEAKGQPDEDTWGAKHD